MSTRGSVGLLVGFVALAAVVVGNVLSAPLAKAYSTEGVRWQYNLSIHFYEQPMQSYDTQAFDDGVYAWNSSVAPILFGGTGTQEVIMSDTNAGNSNWVGLTTWSYSTFGCNYPIGYNQFYDAYTKLNIYYTQKEDRATRQGDAAHELGHAIGLGHSSVTTALMYYKQNGTNTPQSDDINGVNYIYAHSC